MWLLILYVSMYPPMKALFKTAKPWIKSVVLFLRAEQAYLFLSFYKLYNIT